MLVVTPRPAATDSLMGYLLRLSEANGYPTVSYVLVLLHDQWFRSAIGRLDASPLVDIAGLTADEAAHLTLRPQTEPRAYIRILGHDLPTYEVNLRRPKVCPCCLAEGSGCEAFWDLAQATACPVHRVMLVTRCTHCDSNLAWARSKVSKCVCGADLSALPTQTAAAPLCELMALMRYLVYQDQSIAPLPETMGHLAHLTLRQLCKMLWVMSCTLYQRQGGVSMPKARNRYLPQLERIAAGLSNWPDGFQVLLSDMYESEVSTAADVPKFRILFNWLIVRLVKNDENGGTCYRSLEEQLYRFGARFWTRGSMSRGDGDTSLLPETVRWGTIGDAAEILGLHLATTRKLIDSGEIKTRSISTKSKHNLVVDLDWARNQKHSDYRPDPIRNAAKRIGVSIETLKAMRLNGVYEINYRPTYPGCLAKEDVDALRDRLRALGRDTKCKASVGVITVERAFMKYSATPATKATLLGHLLAHPELVKSPGDIRITEMRISTDTARQLLYTNVPIAQGHVTAQDAAVRLRCTPYAVAALKREGHLALHAARGRQLVSEESLKTFETRYESLRAIAARLGISMKRISMYVDLSAVRHVTTCSDVFPTTFIDRADIESAEALLEACRRPPDKRLSCRLRYALQRPAEGDQSTTLAMRV